MTALAKAGLFGAAMVCLLFGAALIKGPAASAAGLNAPVTTFASVADCEKQANGGTPLGFLGLKPWYHFLPDSEVGVNKIGDAPIDPCGIKCFNIFVQGSPNECGETASDIPGVLLAIVDDLLRLAAIVAVAFVLMGSFQYVGSRGNSERTASAQSAIVNALIGLAVSIVAVALVSFIGAQLH